MFVPDRAFLRFQALWHGFWRKSGVPGLMDSFARTRELSGATIYRNKRNVKNIR